MIVLLNLNPCDIKRLFLNNTGPDVFQFKMLQQRKKRFLQANITLDDPNKHARIG